MIVNLGNLKNLLGKSAKATNTHCEAMEAIINSFKSTTERVLGILESSYKEIEFDVELKLHTTTISAAIKLKHIPHVGAPSNNRYIIKIHPEGSSELSTDQGGGAWIGGFDIEFFVLNQIVNFLESKYQ